MNRYLRLYLHFLRFSFSKAMEFRLDMSFRVLMDCIYYFVNIYFFKVIFLHTPLVAGWTEPQMMIFVGGFLLVDAINMTVFSTNLWWLPALINKGELDYYLIRPVAPLFFLSLREFSASSFVNLAIALGFWIYSLVNYPGHFSAGDLFLYVILILNGTLLHYCLQFIMILPVFWTQSPRGFVDLFYSLTIAIERPHRIYRGWLKIAFSTILPLIYISSVPAQIFFEGVDAKSLVQLTVVSIAFWFILNFVWRMGLRNYSSASS